ncbi:DNA-3-methylpurine glycosylase [Magnetococcus marinus MC-1]|uniref:DNA-3-methylpurine glycosylase n=1 Tax=Magnetococcus marinus (strain ATCC BAA-1437 / JCM 17883 / MC-1) TaxID=156889 RepID=A0LAL4_MAGMM|nr:DNA alkylation repair protein [Magnetococcus marinus]ABK45007.1 DNA-3-methylpurine glycosylase [Magnetococcus marinus MC-1]
MEAALHPVQDAALADMVMDERGVAGWAIMPMADYVAERGLHEGASALALLGAMTQRFSAEFAIRPFLQHDPQQSMAQLMLWARDENEHLRRLASEGSRPRLPWGMQLPALRADPTPLWPLLARLMDDPSAYVRRSVANNLNDIAKDHPQQVVDFLMPWRVGASQARLRLMQHACRTLIKQGHAGALALLGYAPPILQGVSLQLFTPQVTLGERLSFGVELQAQSEQNLILDYAIYHVKANGQRTAKVFKWKKLTLSAGQTVGMQRHHPIKVITTRRYYSGQHRLELLVNGQALAGAEFDLRVI